MRNALIALTFITCGGLTFTACGTPDYQYAGYRTYEHFPLDGAERSWEYKHQDKNCLMKVEKLPNPSEDGSKRIHTLEYSIKNPASLVYSIRWSSDSTDGVEIHGYRVESGGMDSWNNCEAVGGADAGGEDEGGTDMGGTDAGGEDAGGTDAGGEDAAGGTEDTGSMSSDVVIGEWVEFDPPLQLTEFQMAPGEAVVSSGGGVDYTTTFETMASCPNDWRDDWDCMKIVIESSEAEPAPFVGTWHWATRFGTSLFQPQGEDYPWTLTTADYIAQ